jgi:hypothetical protein
MAWNLNNKARVNRRSPSAWAICDFCSKQVLRVDLVPDRQYMGTEIRETGFLVCKFTCVDVPQPQEKAILLPPDPLPVQDPRVDIAPNGNFGFTQYMLGNVVNDNGYRGIGFFRIGFSGIGVRSAFVDPQIYPTTEYGFLVSLASISGIAFPLTITKRSTTIVQSNVAQALLPANAARQWVAIYNPGGAQFAISTGTAAFGSLSSMMTGPGECWFWATAQQAGTVWQGPMTVVGLVPGAPVWAWEL